MLECVDRELGQPWEKPQLGKSEVWYFKSKPPEYQAVMLPTLLRLSCWVQINGMT